jgi:hypothetical protein
MEKFKTQYETKILDFEGNPVNQEDGSDLTFGEAIKLAIANYEPDEKTPETKKRVFDIYLKVNDRDSIDEKEKEVVKDACSKMFTPIVYGQIDNIFEGKANFGS